MKTSACTAAIIIVSVAIGATVAVIFIAIADFAHVVTMVVAKPEDC